MSVHHDLVSIPEIRRSVILEKSVTISVCIRSVTHIISLEHLLTPISLGVGPLELEITQKHQNDGQQRARDARPHARLVPRQLVLLAEHETTRDAAHAAETHEGGAAEGALPLTTDVVGLERHGRGDVAVGAGSDEEDAKVADVGVGRPAHDGEADEAENHVEDDDGTADVVLVADPGCCEHDNAGESVGGSHETLSLTDAETHVANENNGERVSESISDSGSIKEDESISPNLPVPGTTEELAKLESGDLGIATVTMDTADDPVSLTLAEEGPSLSLRVGEIDEEPVTGDTQGHGEDTFDDEDPAPARETLTTVELHELHCVSESCKRGVWGLTP